MAEPDSRVWPGSMIDSTDRAVAQGVSTEGVEVGGCDRTVDPEATMDADLDTLSTAVVSPPTISWPPPRPTPAASATTPR